MTVVVLISVGLAGGVSKFQRKQRAIATVARLGGFVGYDYKGWRARAPQQPYVQDAKPPEPFWLRRLLGGDRFAEPVEIQLFADPRMHPERFTDHDAAKLAACSELRWLVLMDTSVTDAGLRHLRHLTKLERLDLEGTRVSEAGIAELRQALPACRIFH